MAEPDYFYPSKPTRMAEMPDQEVLIYLEKASNVFCYQAELYLGLKLNRRFEGDEPDCWFPPALRMLHATDLVVSEVFNGGFLQYFENSSGDSVYLAVEGYRVVGLPAVAEIIEAAVAAVFPPGDWRDRDLRQEHLEALGDAASERLDPFDDTFYALLKQDTFGLSAAFAAYVRSHPDRFFRDDPTAPDAFPWMQGKGY